jgi:hypothetical protein
VLTSSKKNETRQLRRHAKWHRKGQKACRKTLSLACFPHHLAERFSLGGKKYFLLKRSQLAYLTVKKTNFGCDGK